MTNCKRESGFIEILMVLTIFAVATLALVNNGINRDKEATQFKERIMIKPEEITFKPDDNHQITQLPYKYSYDSGVVESIETTTFVIHQECTQCMDQEIQESNTPVRIDINSVINQNLK